MKQSVASQTKLCVLLKQTKPRITLNQNMSTMWIGIERNQEKIKQLEDNIIRYIKKLSEQEKDYFKPVREVIFGTTTYQSNNN